MHVRVCMYARLLHDLVWEGLSKLHFQWNMDFLDLGLHFGCLFELEFVPKLRCGLLWGSQGRPRGVLGTGLDL